MARRSAIKVVRRFTEVALLTVTLSSAVEALGAEIYPSKPIRIIVVYPSGGGTTTLARAIGQKLTEFWGQPVIVDNRPGANGNTGSELAAKAIPDGHTLLMGSANLTVNPSLYPKLRYQPLRDFAPITLITLAPTMLALHPSVPARSVQELIALAKAKPGQLNFASSGTGTLSHLSGELMKNMAGVNIVHVPFKSAGPAFTTFTAEEVQSSRGKGVAYVSALTFLLAGKVQFTFGNPLMLLPHVEAGRLRALAITSAKRSPAFPDIPTVAESGLPGFEAASWYGVLAPAATSKEIVAKLNAEIVRIVRLSDVAERLTREGAEPIGNSSDEFAAFIKAETLKWGDVIKAIERKRAPDEAA